MTKANLYKRDSTGKIRVWSVEYDEEKYRTKSGMLDGKIVESGWKYPKPKNVGKANETTVEQQVLNEVESLYEKQSKQGKYHNSIEEAMNGAPFVEPMLAQTYNPEKDTDFPYHSNPKLDGGRCVVTSEMMQTRNGLEWVSAPHILENLKRYFEQFPDYPLDGELYNHEMKHDFEKLMSLVRKTKPTKQDLAESKKLVQLHVYDVITPEPMTYAERWAFLVENVKGLFDSIEVVSCTQINSAEEAEEQHGKYLEAGYEGQMLRKNDIPYEHKRSKSLLKHKAFKDGEFEIVDIIEGVGNWAGYAKSIQIRLPDGETQESGMRGNFEFAEKILKERDELIGTDVTVRYQCETAYGKLKFPVVTHFWRGKRDV